ncbi:phage repressor protein [Candidatus Liberibacter americanus]|uniref:Prophage antirepressor n=1 Tax=Candidatus Liberibacter americanus str. Sao Paulo TaxID=1261131 RepID=U6B5I0_9HYPH|nr:phage repressor protein [Candidatus Liberibacter americanus]AHA28008.1 Prophage antirepressor [Candidatus Liberibacter americanus str. Sao Paulo]EMS35795.1 prophage antirepressor [Candidatus Liberibacter americanus PW_SP]
MSNLIPFEFESNNIRTLVDKQGNPLFVAKDIAEALGYNNPSDAVYQHCDGSVFYRTIIDSLGRNQKTRVIKEPDVYRLIVKSKLPSAKKFERWLFEDVLPTIRKTGSYSISSKTVSPNTLLRLHKHFEQIAKQAGLKENQLLLKVNQGVTRITGINQLEAMDIAYLPSADNDEYLTPTQIGQQLTPLLNPQAVNRLLLDLSLQVQNHGSKGYVPTSLGEELGGRMMDVSKAHTSGSTQQLRWNQNKIVQYLQSYMDKQDNKKECHDY